MDLFEIIIITLQIANAFTKKYASSSDESIENLLYYKDCQRKGKEPTEAPTLLRGAEPPKRQPDCPFPKMCCSLSCGNDCDSSPQSFVSRQMDPLQDNPLSMMNMNPPSPPRQPPLMMQSKLAQRGRNKQLNPLSKIKPIGARRDFGFTKEKIKSLISQDGDIRKILKDLVRVTMQKVDLQELINNRSNANVKTADVSKSDDDYEFE